MNSCRCWSHVCPVRVRKAMPACHSSKVRSTSRTKSCRWRTRLVRIAFRRGSASRRSGLDHGLRDGVLVEVAHRRLSRPGRSLSGAAFAPDHDPTPPVRTAPVERVVEQPANRTPLQRPRVPVGTRHRRLRRRSSPVPACRSPPGSSAHRARRRGRRGLAARPPPRGRGRPGPWPPARPGGVVGGGVGQHDRMVSACGRSKEPPSTWQSLWCSAMPTVPRQAPGEPRAA